MIDSNDTEPTTNDQLEPKKERQYTIEELLTPEEIELLSDSQKAEMVNFTRKQFRRNDKYEENHTVGRKAQGSIDDTPASYSTETEAFEWIGRLDMPSLHKVLLAAREMGKLTQRQLSQALDWSETRVSRIFTEIREMAGEPDASGQWTKKVTKYEE